MKEWNMALRAALALTLIMATGCADTGGGDDDDGSGIFDAGGLDGSGNGGDADLDGSSDGSGQDPDASVDPDADDSGDTTPPDTDADTGIDPDTDTTEDTTPPLPTDWPEDADLVRITLDGGNTGTGTATVNFADYTPLDDLAWLSSAGVRCYDNAATTDEFFSQNHISFVLDQTVPAWSEVTVTVTPTESNAEAAFYILLQQPNRYQVPPDVDDVSFCHMPVQIGGPGTAGTYTFRTYADSPRDVLIGVSNRGRFRGDATSDVTVDVTVTPLAEGDRCYDGIEDPDRWPENVVTVRLDENGRAVVSGNLTQGAPVCGDLEWIDDAFCAPSTRLDRFGGSHVFYQIEGGMPDQSVLTVTAVPDPGVDISLYGAQQGAGTGFETPPSFNVAGCEASYDIRIGEGYNPGEIESLYFNATTNPYNVFVGVAGDDQQGAEGAYTLVFELISYDSDVCTEEQYSSVSNLDEWPEYVTPINTARGFAQVEGDNSDGQIPCTLDWADSSQVACFPGTRFSFFRGATDYFVLDPPPPVGATVRVRAVPLRDDVEVSLFGYRLGPDNVIVPPLVPGVPTCEASYTFGIGEEPNPGETEEITFGNSATNPNPYTYFLGVAAYNSGEGDDQLTGPYRLEVEVTERPPGHCEESLPGATFPTWPSFVRSISVDEDGAGSIRGNLEDGSCVNLDFASSSQVACFPATQNDRFEGNHVFFHLDEPMPPNSELIVTITPDAGVDVNAYGLLTGTTEFSIPPNVTGAVCESSLDYSGPNPGEVERLYFANPTDTNRYNIMIAVAGDNETGTSGGFTIDVQLNTSTTFCEESLPGPTGLTDWPDSVQEITIDADGGFNGTGSLDAGSCTNLDFAERSDVACFPSIRNDRYDGNHNFYGLTNALPPNSFMTITVVPRTPDVDVSLYGLLMGNTEFLVPPNVVNTQCEASYALGLPNPGAGESITFYNPTPASTYNVMFGVAGARGATNGNYNIEIRRNIGAVHCEESLPGRTYSAWPPNVQLLRLTTSTPATFEANLDDGECTNLDFAQNSSLACFPGTLFDDFEGPHNFYALSEPLIPNRRVRVSVTPGSRQPVNLYGYTTRFSEFYVPPMVPAGTCEYALDNDTASGPHSITFDTGRGDPYNLFFAVAGPDGATAGAYTLRVEYLPEI